MGLSTSSKLSPAASTARPWAEPLEHRLLLSGSYVKDELLVQYRPGATEREIAEVRSLLDAGLKERLGRHAAEPRERRRAERRRGSGAVDLLSLPDGMSVASAIERIGSHSAVSIAEANYLIETAATPNDPSFNQLWGLHNTGQSKGTADADIDAPEAWNITTGSNDVVVFVIDTGIDYNHPDLRDNIWRNPFEIPGNGIDDEGNGYVDDVHGIDTFNGDSDPLDTGGHGTHVAGTIGARGNNGTGVAGVNWNVRIGACQAFPGNGSGTNAAILECLEYINDLKARGVNVVATNNSWESVSGHGVSGPFEGGIIRGAMDGPAGVEKILHVVAAGNDAWNNDAAALHPVAWPASWNLDNILSVAASDRKDIIAGFSNWGPTTVDLAAPGVSIYSTMRGGSYTTMSGTSMATPHATGAAALVAAAHPGLSAEAIKLALMDATDYIGNRGSNASKPTVTNGRLNVHRALVNLGAGDVTAPAAASDLSVSRAGLWSVHLAWTATGDDGLTGTARSYDVRYSTSPITEENWVYARSAATEPRPASSGTTETFRVQRLARDTTYYFAVKVRDETGNESALSNVAAAATAQPTVVFADGFENGMGQWTAQSPWGRTTAHKSSGDYSAADSPSGNYANNVDSSLTSLPIDLSDVADTHLTFWSRGESEWAIDYLRVEASANGGSTWTNLASYTGFTDGFSYVLDLSAYDGQSDVRVRFRFTSDGANTLDGRYLDDIELVGKSLPPDATAPSAPANLAVTAATGTSISLAWSPSTDDRGVVAYDIYRANGAGSVLAGTSTTTSHTVTGLSPATSYSFHVVARDAAGNASAASSSITASTLAAPAAPSNLAATNLSNRRVRLNWADNSANETGFHVWSSRDNVNWTLMATTATNATSHTTGTLARGNWHFRVSAFNLAGDSLFTSVVSVNV